LGCFRGAIYSHLPISLNLSACLILIVYAPILFARHMPEKKEGHTDKCPDKTRGYDDVGGAGKLVA